jgi:hypothetical protein
LNQKQESGEKWRMNAGLKPLSVEKFVLDEYD